MWRLSTKVKTLPLRFFKGCLSDVDKQCLVGAEDVVKEK